MKISVVDFETEAFDPLPTGRAPKPVGVAIKPPRGKSKYWAWGHPTGNNCTRAEGARALFKCYAESDLVLFFNAPFDLMVSSEHMGMMPKRWGDVLVMAYLHDPYAFNLQLKPLADKYLDLPPEEKDAIREWLIEHGVISKQLKKNWEAYICKAPGDLVGRYAIGDVDRTHGLYKLWSHLAKGEAYDREIRAQPVLIAMERQGVPLNEDLIASDLTKYTALFGKTEDDICKRLRIPKGSDLSDQTVLPDALESRYGITLPTTASGRRSIARDVVLEAVPDSQLKALLVYHSSLKYAMNSYMRPWLAASRVTGGTVHPHWNGVRGSNASGGGGARTGRLSSNPNLQNIRDTEKEQQLVESLIALYGRRAWDLPLVRRYIEARKGQLLIGRDWSQIELRLTAEYEDAAMKAQYIANPEWDLHQWVIDTVLERHGVKIPHRRIAKNIGFGIIYGAGKFAIAAQSKIPPEQAQAFKNLYFAVLPGVKQLMDDVMDRGRRGGAIKTLGGRMVKVQPGVIGKFGFQTFEYKLLNYLIQGSAAEMMKEALIAYHEDTDRPDAPLIMSVHDEPVVLSKHKRDNKHAMACLKRAMHESNELVGRLEVPILSNGYTAQNWAETIDL